MINISNELKQIYNNDIFPIINQSVPKDLIIYFPVLDLTIETDRIVDESFELEEGLFADKDIFFGACEAAQVKFTLADVEQDLKGQVFTLTQIVNGVHTMPLGTYTVHSCIKQDDLRFKDIIAYDYMKKTDVDVSDWYNSLSFPIILKSFRASLLSYLGIEEEIRDLPNDDMVITKTIQPTKLRGRDVLVCLEEINGCFGHISRLGKFTHVVLEPSYGLYPALTLFPSSDLYPVSENDTTFFQEGSESVFINYPMYAKVRFEEYTTKEITKIQIRQEAGDIGSIVGDGTNLYVIEGNFLLYGKGASELETIARNAFGNMQKRPYRPFESENIGLPYLEVGDTVSFETEANVASYVFRRTLKGIQALRDFFSATGSEEIEQSFSVNKEIKQLQGKTNVLVRNVDELSNTITDVEQGLESKITQTASELRTEYTNIEDDLYSEINQIAGTIVLKVDAAGNIGYIELDGDPNTDLTSIKLKANNIELEGLVTANNNFKILADGSIEAVNGKFSGIIESAIVKGSAFETYANNGYFLSSAWDGNQYGNWNLEARIENGQIKVGRTNYHSTGGTFEVATTIDWNRIYSNKVHGSEISGVSADFSTLEIGSVGLDGKIIFDSNYYFRPKISTRDCYIGSSSYPWTAGYFKNFSHTNSSGTLGFFGTSPTTRKSVSKISNTSGATAASNASKINEILTALASYGLLLSS